MIDGIIFDLDGTLWDSTNEVAASWSKTVKAHTGHNPNYTGDGLKPYFGKLLSEIAEGLFPHLPREDYLALMELCTLEENIYLKEHPGTLYPGLEAALMELHKIYPLFIVSNCQSGYIEAFLEVTGFSHYFTDHLCPGDTDMPKAANITEIKNRHHLLSPVYVGDTQGDLDACKESDTPFIFASYGFGSPAEYIAKIESLSQLKDVIEKL